MKVETLFYVDVTERDIELGLTYPLKSTPATSCPIAQAIKRQTGMTPKEFAVGSLHLIVELPNSSEYAVYHPTDPDAMLKITSGADRYYDGETKEKPAPDVILFQWWGHEHS